jgi:ubiquitin-like-conjugating enzyme ATG3
MEDAVRMFKDAREYLTPVLTESAFLSKGMLTPEEFVQAGDHLIKTSPSWTWESGETSKLRPYLPSTKQFLLTRGVPCYSRISSLEVDSFVEENVQFGSEGEKGGDGEEWFYTHNAQAAKPTAAAAPESKEDEYLDMEDDSLALDEATQSISNMNVDGNSNVKKTRRYDVSITYDNYYRTPRIWLFGYDENGSPLEPTAIFEDVMTDYAKRTVTIDPHPHTSKPHGELFPVSCPFSH